MLATTAVQFWPRLWASEIDTRETVLPLVCHVSRLKYLATTIPQAGHSATSDGWALPQAGHFHSARGWSPKRVGVGAEVESPGLFPCFLRTPAWFSFRYTLARDLSERPYFSFSAEASIPERMSARISLALILFFPESLMGSFPYGPEISLLKLFSVGSTLKDFL